MFCKVTLAWDTCNQTMTFMMMMNMRAVMTPTMVMTTTWTPLRPRIPGGEDEGCEGGDEDDHEDVFAGDKWGEAQRGNHWSVDKNTESYFWEKPTPVLLCVCVVLLEAQAGERSLHRTAQWKAIREAGGSWEEPNGSCETTATRDQHPPPSPTSLDAE